MKIINDYIPLSNVAGDIWQGYVASPYNTDEVLLKIDHQLNDAHRFSGSYFFTTGENETQAGSGNLPWALYSFNWTQHNLNVSDTWVVSTNKINQLWFSFNRNYGGRLNLPETSLTDLGSSAIIQGAPALPQITVSGYFTLTNAIGGPTAGGDFYSMRDVFSWTKTKHAFKMGGELSYNKTIQDTLLNNYGVFTFNNSVTKNALADFLIGIPSAVTQDAPVTGALEQLVRRGLHPGRLPHQLANLTLNLGLRWDVQTPGTDPQNRFTTYVPGQKSTARPDAPVGPALLRRPRRRARRHPDGLEPRVAARRHRVGSVRRRQDVDPRGGRRVLRQHLGQRVEHDDELPAVVHAADVRDLRGGRGNWLMKTPPALPSN